LAVLVPWDLTVPTLRAAFEFGTYVRLPAVPSEPAEADDFRRAMDAQRASLLGRDVPVRWQLSAPAGVVPGGLGPPSWPDDVNGLGPHLADLSARRWWLATEGAFIEEVRRSVGRDKHVDQLRLALAGTLAPFALEGLLFRDGSTPAACMEQAALGAGASRADPDESGRLEELRRILGDVASRDRKLALDPALPGFEGDGPFLWGSLNPYGWETGANPLLLYAFGPEPLATLERRVLGRPELKAK